MSDELLDSNYWHDLRAVLDEMDTEIAGLYTEAGLSEIRTRFVGPLIQLARRGPMTIRELATSRDVSHSAMSQTAAAMRRAGLVEDAAGRDGRARSVQLTAKSRAVMPFLEAEWRATEATVRQLDAELPYSLNRVAEDMRAALERHPFGWRLRDNLAAALDGRLR